MTDRERSIVPPADSDWRSWDRTPLARRWLTPRRIFLTIFLLSLAVNLIAGLALLFRSQPNLFDSDEREYYGISTQILAGNFEVTPRRTLLFPIIIAAIRLIYDNVLFLQIGVTVLYSLSAPLLFLLVRKLSKSNFCGALSGLLLAVWPPAIFYGTSLYSETAALPAFILALYALPLGTRVAADAPNRYRQALIAGLLLALATQIRPMYLLFTPFLVIILFWEERRFAVAAKRALLAAAGFMILILPWSAYMTTRFGHPILVTSNGGETLSGGLNPRLLDNPEDWKLTTPSGRKVQVGVGKWLPTYMNGYLSAADLDLPYDQQDLLLRSRTTAWIKANPGRAAYIEFRKLTYMWGFYPFAANGLSQCLFGNIPTIAMLLVALVGFARSPGLRARLVRLWIAPFFVSGVALISWGSWRFRQPADACLLAFDVLFLLSSPWVVQRWRHVKSDDIA